MEATASFMPRNSGTVLSISCSSYGIPELEGSLRLGAFVLFLRKERTGCEMLANGLLQALGRSPDMRCDNMWRTMELLRASIRALREGWAFHWCGGEL